MLKDLKEKIAMMNVQMGETQQRNKTIKRKKWKFRN